jgi:hypothetical protein
MKRLSPIFLALLFVTGALIVPFIHQSCCANEHGAHDAGNCAICQIARTPLQLSAVVLAPVDTVRRVDTLIPAARFIPSFSPRSVTQARAPPV